MAIESQPSTSKSHCFPPTLLTVPLLQCGGLSSRQVLATTNCDWALSASWSRRGLREVETIWTIFFSLFFYLFHRTLVIQLDFFFFLALYWERNDRGNEIDAEDGVYTQTMLLSAGLAIFHLSLIRVRATSKDGL